MGVGYCSLGGLMHSLLRNPESWPTGVADKTHAHKLAHALYVIETHSCVCVKQHIVILKTIRSLAVT